MVPVLTMSNTMSNGENSENMFLFSLHDQQGPLLL